MGFSTSLLTDGEGNHLGAVEVFFDLTHLKELEQEVTRVKTLAALGEMAATVAHEVRNPLGGIAGFAALLERDLEPEDPRKRLVNKIIEGGGRMAGKPVVTPATTIFDDSIMSKRAVTSLW